MNIKREICNSFNAHAKEYESAAKIQLEIGNRLIRRLDYFRFTPKNILDLGCASGFFTKLLTKRYPKANVMGIDLAFSMLQEAKKNNVKDILLSNADLNALPFANNSFDLVFSNQVIHWSDSLSTALQEIQRVMQVDGCLIFSTLGPGSLVELKQAWSLVDKHSHVLDFIEMHNLGDLLLKQGFKDPVVDMENIITQYKSPINLIKNLKAQGVRNINQQRNPGLTGKSTWKALQDAFIKNNANKYPLTYEVIYGHAWKSQLNNLKNEFSESYISLKQIRENFANIKVSADK